VKQGDFDALLRSEPERSSGGRFFIAVETLGDAR
jgi:hypothetical protein